MKCALCFAENADGSESCAGCGRLLGSAGFTPSSGAPRGLLATGSMLSSRYEIRTLLGRGGMGMVYKAHDRVLDETVALKVLLSDVSEAPEMAQRFRSEIKLARKVRHRNVCAIHEYGEDGPLRFITMEFIEGTDLKHLLLERGAFPQAEAFEVTIQAAEGLQAIHDVGVVHRDLKTSNVMLDRVGVVRLMDFGIAKQLGIEGSPAATAVGHILGTPEYMSPEQARGAQIDFRSDIYAVGVIVYEVFTGHVPFHGMTPIATLFKQLEEPLRIEGPEAALIPPALAPVVRAAMAKEVEGRYQSARELAAALREARARTFAAPTPPPVGPHVETGPQTTTLSGATLPPRVAATVVMPATSSMAAAPRAATPVRRREVANRRTLVDSTSPGATVRSATSVRRNVGAWLAAFAMVFTVAAIGMALALRALLRNAPADGGVAASPFADSPAAARAPSGLAAPRGPEASLVVPAVTPPPTTGTPRPTATVATPAPGRAAAPPVRGTAPERAPAEAASHAPTPREMLVPGPDPTSGAKAPATQAAGVLQLHVTPWAEVSVDGAPAGTTPLKPLPLAAGVHTIRLSHPDYKPLQRKVTLQPGETTKLEVDLTWEAFPKNE